MKQKSGPNTERLLLCSQKTVLITLGIVSLSLMTTAGNLSAEDSSGNALNHNRAGGVLASANQAGNNNANGVIAGTQDDTKLLDDYINTIQGSTLSFDASNIKQFWVDNSVSARNGNINIILTKKEQWNSVPLKIQLANVSSSQKCKVFIFTEETDVGFSVTNSKSKVVSKSSYEEDFVHHHIYSSTFFLKDTFPEYSFNLIFSSNAKDLIAIKRIVLSFEQAPELLVIRKPEIKVIPPVADQNADEARKKHIESEKERITAIADSMGSLTDVYKTLQVEKTQKEFNNVLFSMDASIKNFANHLPKDNAVEGLSALNRFLLKNGIHLVVLVWPNPDEVSADLFFPEVFKEGQDLDLRRIELIKGLLDNDVEVVDLFPALVKNRFQYPPLLFQAHFYDSLPASGASRIAGEEIANLLKRYKLAASNENDKWSLVESPMRKGREYKDHKEITVSLNGAKNTYDNKSDVLVVGDATAYHPQDISSFTAFTSFYLQKKVGYSTPGGTAGPQIFKYLIQKQQADGLLNQKKVVIASIVHGFITTYSFDIPAEFPDFLATTYIIQKSFSPYNQFKGIKATWAVSKDEVDFSSGKAVPQNANQARERIKLVLPDMNDVSQNSFLRIVTESTATFSLTFNELDSEDVKRNGAVSKDEQIIPVKTGKEMSITIPATVFVLDISYIKKQ